MKPVLIVENSTNSLIRESSSTRKDYVLGGTFTEFGVKNRNERIYTADKFIPALDEMNERMNSLGAVYGEFDHPDVFDTSYQEGQFKKTASNKKLMNEMKSFEFSNFEFSIISVIQTFNLILFISLTLLF